MVAGGLTIAATAYAQKAPPQAEWEAATAGITGAEAGARDAPVELPESVHWQTAVDRCGVAFGLQVSLERDELGNKPGANGGSRLGATFVRPAGPVKDGDDFVRQLPAWLPAGVVTVDPRVKGFVHVVERTLADDPAYMLGQKVSLKYEGTAGGLLKELERGSDGRVTKDATVIFPGPQFSYDTRVKVDVADVTYRELLSLAVVSMEAAAAAPATGPAATAGSQRPRVKVAGLRWEAYTQEKEGKKITYVGFKGV
jgi:hypothetical protein